MDAARDGRVLGGQAEGVEADGEEDVVALHAPEASHGIGQRHDRPVPDVQVPGRVRVHRHDVVLGPRLVAQVGVVEPELIPARLPARLDLGRVVSVHRAPSAVGSIGARGRWGGRRFGCHGSGLDSGEGRAPASRSGWAIGVGRAARSGAGDPGKAQEAERAADGDRHACHGSLRWWSDGGSNPGPSACHADALPAELSPRVARILPHRSCRKR